MADILNKSIKFVEKIKVPPAVFNAFGAIKKINHNIVFSDIHLLIGGIPALILPIFGFLAACI